MIPIIEDSISALLADAFSFLKKNPDEIGKILKMDSKKVQDLSTYLSSTDIKIKRGYPRTPAELPCVCILLSSEEESQEGVGDYTEDMGSINSAFREELVVQSDITLYDGKPFVQLSKFPVMNVGVVYNTYMGIEYSSSDIDISELRRGIILLPSTSEEGDRILIEYTYSEIGLDGVYSQFESNYRIETWTSNADLTVQIYYLTKWALMVGRDRLHLELSLYRQRMSGADFQPAPSFFPDFVYRRALSFWCQLTESAPVKEIDYISKIEVNKTIDFDTQLGGGENNG